MPVALFPAVLAGVLAALSQGKTWPMLGAQFLLGISWWISKRSRETTIPLPWMLAAAGVVFLGTLAPPSSADESAYRFQARVFASGQLAAPAPAGNLLVNNAHKNEFFLIHTIQREGKWFVQYYPGWPAVLALPEKLGLGAFVNPALGLLVVWLTWKIAMFLGGPQAGGLATFFLVASPMFLLNFSGYYSHGMTCALVAAAAWWAVTDSGDSWWNVSLTALALAAAGLGRPLTAVVCGFPLVLLLVWRRRQRPAALAGCLALVAAFAGAAIAIQAFYIYQQTGTPWRSLYAVYRGEDNLRLLAFTPAELLINIRDLTVRGILKAGAATFAFPALLGGVWLAAREKKAEHLALAAMVVLLPAAYAIVIEQSDTVIGERYYLECLFAVAVLAAIGLRGAAPRRVLLASLAVAAASTFWFHRVYETRRAPFAAVEAAVSQRTNPDEVIFLDRAGHPDFNPYDTNMNYPDWPSSRHFSMPDPGPERRGAVTCALGKKQWIVLTADRVPSPPQGFCPLP
jgi:hypothetical protein